MSTFRERVADDHYAKELAIELARIYERAQEESLALLESQPVQPVLPPVREWMSATQLAEYWQLYNDKNEPTTAGILKWSRRPQAQFPLPTAYMGDLLRFNRIEVDVWAKKKPKDDEFKMKSGA